MSKKCCTTMLVGKAASLSGGPMIARNEDSAGSPTPQSFRLITAEAVGDSFKPYASETPIPLPPKPLSYTATPDVTPEQGVFAAAGFNSENIGMTGTETLTSNSRVLAADPYVADGIGEADFVSLVLPFIHSAKEGVERLGELLETYGTYEANGMAFIDEEEIWYMESIGGHHWAARRIPDDCFVIAPNRLNLDWFDFDDPNVLYCKDLPDFIERYRLNPDHHGLNLRHALGSADWKDICYNNPREWYVLKHLADTSRPYVADQPFVDDPDYADQPFLNYPKRKLSIEDVKWALSSHYEETPYDPYSQDPVLSRKYRAIGLNRNQELHILEIRPDKPKMLKAIHWLAFGSNPYNCVLPFYSQVLDTPAAYRDTPATYDPNYSFWQIMTLAAIADADYERYKGPIHQFEKERMAEVRAHLYAMDEALEEQQLNGQAALEFLTEANKTLAEIHMQKTQALLGDILLEAYHHMTLRYQLAD